jgi:hypothetical protein
MSESPLSQPSSTKGRVVLWLAGLGVPLLLLVAWWPSGKPKSRSVLPNPNGYDSFIKLAGQLQGIPAIGPCWTNATWRVMPIADLRSFVTTNSGFLELVREGLRLPCHAPTDYDEGYQTRYEHVLGGCKRLGHCLVGEGYLAELDGKPADALQSYLDCQRLGQESSRGALIFDRSVGLVIEHLGLTYVLPLIPTLDAVNARKCLEGLMTLDKTHDAPAVNFANEDEWISKAFPLGQRIALQIHPMMRKDNRDWRDKFANKVGLLQASRRRAIVETAARLFELDMGRRPTGYADLVPAYLKAIPLDPTIGKEIAHPF